jgi:hypothetical protein
MRNTGHGKEHDSGCDYQWRFHVGSFIYVEFSIHAIRYSRALSSKYSSLRTSQGRFSSSRRPTAPGALDECLLGVAVIFILGQAKRRRNAHA